MAIVNVGMGRAPWRLPTYTGSAEIFGTKDKGYIVIYSTGTLKFPGSGTVERVQMGSGLAGAKPSSSQTGQTQTGGAGGYGAGMWVKQAFTVKRNVEYQIEIASACSSNTEANLTKSFGGWTTTDGRGASGGTAGTASASGESTNAGNGGNGNKTPWSSNPLVPPPGSFCAGGGGGGAWLRYANQSYSANAGTGGTCSGNDLTGGNGAVYSNTRPSGNGYDGSATCGGGGGGRRYGDNPNVAGSGGKGGSGIVIVRWGYV